jgi:hypothetical protein
MAPCYRAKTGSYVKVFPSFAVFWTAIEVFEDLKFSLTEVRANSRRRVIDHIQRYSNELHGAMPVPISKVFALNR